MTTSTTYDLGTPPLPGAVGVDGAADMDSVPGLPHTEQAPSSTLIDTGFVPLPPTCVYGPQCAPHEGDPTTTVVWYTTTSETPSPAALAAVEPARTLPRTGDASAPIAGVGAGFLVAGAIALLAARRRRRAPAKPYSFRASVLDAGGGQVGLLVDLDTPQYPLVGDVVTVTVVEPSTTFRPRRRVVSR